MRSNDEQACLDAAMCVWETICEYTLRSEKKALPIWEKVTELLSHNGCAVIRMQVAAVIEHIVDAYTIAVVAAGEDYEGDFESDFLPEFLSQALAVDAPLKTVDLKPNWRELAQEIGRCSVDSTVAISLTRREQSTMLAALRFLQHSPVSDHAGIASQDGELNPLSDDEIDDFCERLNSAASAGDAFLKLKWRH